MAVRRRGNGRRRGRASGAGATAEEPWWATLPREELLDVRLCDLGLRIQGTTMEDRVARLHTELERRGMRFRPHVWFSTDWFSPDGVVGFAVPFFLGHPRLMRLEHRMMFEVEGGNRSWCMRLMRHETGHAIDNAYRLHWKKRWREVFGKFSQPYHMSYVPNPRSRAHVQNLDFWYAQSHPAEDFAETFAVWLTPRASWRKQYRGWPALRKLEFVDELMAGIADAAPVVKDRSRPDSLSRQRMTLREYYERKRDYYQVAATEDYDGHLERIFSREVGPRRYETAARFLARHRGDLRARVASLTGAYRYVVDQAIDALILRCKQLGLRLTREPREALVDAAILVAVRTLGFLRGERPTYWR